MSCYINQGITLGCSDGLGSLKTLYILGGSTGATITSTLLDAQGEITGATGSGVWYQFELKRNTSSLQQTLAKSFEAGTAVWSPTVVGVFYKYDAAKRDFAKILSQNDDVKIIAVDYNDVQYLVGEENGLYLSAADIGTGTAITDRNGGTLTWLGQESAPARVIDGTLSTVFSGFTFA